MPPEEEIKMRLDFVYLAEERPDKDPAVFWKSFGKHRPRGVEVYVAQRPAPDWV